MNIALMSHDNKKELMVQFCTASPASCPTTTFTPPTPLATWWPTPRA